MDGVGWWWGRVEGGSSRGRREQGERDGQEGEVHGRDVVKRKYVQGWAASQGWAQVG